MSVSILPPVARYCVALMFCIFFFPPVPASANTCLQQQKQQVADNPFFSFTRVDHKAFDDIREVNRKIARAKDDKEVNFEYWAGNLKHFLLVDKDGAEDTAELQILFDEKNKDEFFLEMSYRTRNAERIYGLSQTFIVDKECRKNLVDTHTISLSLVDNRIVITSYMDGELEVETIEMDGIPKEFGLITTAQILKMQGHKKTSAFYSVRAPNVDVTISDSYSEEMLYDKIMHRDVTVNRKHLVYEYEGVGRIDMEVSSSPLSFYKKITLNGLATQNTVFERVTRGIWINTPLSHPAVRVNFITPLRAGKGKRGVEAYKILSNLPLEHAGPASYPYIKAVGRRGDKYEYRILADVEYQPVETEEPKGDIYLKSTYYINVDSPKLAQYVKMIDQSDPLEMVNTILILVNHFMLTFDAAQEAEGNTRMLTTDAVIEKGKGVCQHYASLVVALCRAKNISARIIRGYVLGENGYFDHAWVEVYINNSWLPLEPQASLPGRSRLSNRYIPVIVWEDYESMSNINNLASSLRFCDYRFTVERVSAKEEK